MAKKTKQTTDSAAVTMVYVGPPKPGLSTYTLFRGGILPQYVKNMIAENHAIKELIVPVDRLPEARLNIKQKGHVLNHFARKV